MSKQHKANYAYLLIVYLILFGTLAYLVSSCGPGIETGNHSHKVEVTNHE